MPFKSRVDVEVYQANEWVLTADVIWTSPRFGTITAPRGFVTDFASTPQLMHALPWFDPSREGRSAAVIHDYLYCSHRHSWTDVNQDHVYSHAQSRAWCDHVLLEALQDGGMNRELAEMYHFGVRIGGWLAWAKRGDGLNDDDFVASDYFTEPASIPSSTPKVTQ